MALRPNLTFAGNAQSAIDHYQETLGGDVDVFRFAGSPAADQVPADWAEKVLYATVRTPYGDVNVMDAPPGREGTPGDNFAIAVDIADEGRAAEVFSKLADGGAVLMPFEQTFFAQKFGMANDKFGVRWMVSVRAEQ